MLEILAGWIIGFINNGGYLAVFTLMTIESALIPLPSEITMPFAGSQISSGYFNLWLLGLVGGLGNLAGSLLGYALGFWGQEKFIRQFIKKYGKYILLNEKEFDRSQSWFNKYGETIVFTSRLLPAVRTFISLPAGIARMEIKKFIVYTTIGSILWSVFLAWLGLILGKNWHILGSYFQKFDIVILFIALAAGFWYIRHKIKTPPPSPREIST